MKNQISKGDRIAAPVVGAFQFGLITIVISYFFTGINFETLSIWSILLRAVPGVIVGAIIGLKFPKVALFFGQISIG